MFFLLNCLFDSLCSSVCGGECWICPVGATDTAFASFDAAYTACGPNSIIRVGGNASIPEGYVVDGDLEIVSGDFLAETAVITTRNFSLNSGFITFQEVTLQMASSGAGPLVRSIPATPEVVFFNSILALGTTASGETFFEGPVLDLVRATGSTFSAFELVFDVPTMGPPLSAPSRFELTSNTFAMTFDGPAAVVGPGVEAYIITDNVVRDGPGFQIDLTDCDSVVGGGISSAIVGNDIQYALGPGPGTDYAIFLTGTTLLTPASCELSMFDQISDGSDYLDTLYFNGFTLDWIDGIIKSFVGEFYNDILEPLRTLWAGQPSMSTSRAECTLCVPSYDIECDNGCPEPIYSPLQGVDVVNQTACSVDIVANFTTSEVCFFVDAVASPGEALVIDFGLAPLDPRAEFGNFANRVEDLNTSAATFWNEPVSGGLYLYPQTGSANGWISGEAGNAYRCVAIADLDLILDRTGSPAVIVETTTDPETGVNTTVFQTPIIVRRIARDGNTTDDLDPYSPDNYVTTCSVQRNIFATRLVNAEGAVVSDAITVNEVELAAIAQQTAFNGPTGDFGFTAAVCTRHLETTLPPADSTTTTFLNPDIFGGTCVGQEAFTLVTDGSGFIAGADGAFTGDPDIDCLDSSDGLINLGTYGDGSYCCKIFEFVATDSQDLSEISCTLDFGAQVEIRDTVRFFGEYQNVTGYDVFGSRTAANQTLVLDEDIVLDLTIDSYVDQARTQPTSVFTASQAETVTWAVAVNITAFNDAFVGTPPLTSWSFEIDNFWRCGTIIPPSFSTPAQPAYGTSQIDETGCFDPIIVTTSVEQLITDGVCGGACLGVTPFTDDYDYNVEVDYSDRVSGTFSTTPEVYDYAHAEGTVVVNLDQSGPLARSYVSTFVRMAPGHPVQCQYDGKWSDCSEVMADAVSNGPKPEFQFTSVQEARDWYDHARARRSVDVGFNEDSGLGLITVTCEQGQIYEAPDGELFGNCLFPNTTIEIPFNPEDVCPPAGYCDADACEDEAAAGEDFACFVDDDGEPQCVVFVGFVDKGGVLRAPDTPDGVAIAGYVVGGVGLCVLVAFFAGVGTDRSRDEEIITTKTSDPTDLLEGTDEGSLGEGEMRPLVRRR